MLSKAIFPTALPNANLLVDVSTSQCITHVVKRKTALRNLAVYCFANCVMAEWRTVFTHSLEGNFQPADASKVQIFRYLYNFEPIEKIYVKKTRKQRQKFSS